MCRRVALYCFLVLGGGLSFWVCVNLLGDYKNIFSKIRLLAVCQHDCFECTQLNVSNINVTLCWSAFHAGHEPCSSKESSKLLSKFTSDFSYQISLTPALFIQPKMTGEQKVVFAFSIDCPTGVHRYNERPENFTQSCCYRCTPTTRLKISGVTLGVASFQDI